MGIKRSMVCDKCGVLEVEKEPNAGWKGWSGIQGVSLNGMDNPNLCPICTAKVMEFIDKGMNDGVD